MVTRRRKKRNKQLGSRTRGKGDTKNRRGAGSRGGRGLAGSHKHKYSKYHGKFGKEKKRPKQPKKEKALNLEQLNQAMPKLLAKGKAYKEGDTTVIDGTKTGIVKLLSRGSPKEKLLVKNTKASKKAIEKIKKAGGKIEEIQKEEKTKEKSE